MDNKLTIRFITESLSKKCNISFESASEIVDDSFIIELLEEDPDYVTHYNPEYWADEIMQDLVVN